MLWMKLLCCYSFSQLQHFKVHTFLLSIFSEKTMTIVKTPNKGRTKYFLICLGRFRKEEDKTKDFVFVLGTFLLLPAVPIF